MAHDFNKNSSTIINDQQQQQKHQPGLIYGLDHECRALCSQYSDYLPTRFFIGTQSIKPEENQVHLIEYQDDQDLLNLNNNDNKNQLSKVIFHHPYGEIWNLISISKQPQQLFTNYSNLSSESNRIENFFTQWKLPIDLTQPLNENEISNTNNNINSNNNNWFNLEKLQDFERKLFDENLGRLSYLKPDNENELLLLLETKLALIDLETKILKNYLTINNSSSTSTTSSSSSLTQQQQQNKSTTTINRQTKINTFKWNPHFNSNIVSIVLQNNIYSKDLRCGNNNNDNCWQITQAHHQLVRDLDFNPNSQYYLATCGDDCFIKFWDLRNLKKPIIKPMLFHTHWVWSIRYNTFHDYLILTSSSDCNVNLLKINSIASKSLLLNEPIIDDNELLLEEEDNVEQLKKSDGLIRTIDDHADSVYRIEWSPNDPWIFASLSYDGRLILNKVPEEEKINIIG